MVTDVDPYLLNVSVLYLQAWSVCCDNSYSVKTAAPSTTHHWVEI